MENIPGGEVGDNNQHESKNCFLHLVLLIKNVAMQNFTALHA